LDRHKLYALFLAALIMAVVVWLAFLGESRLEVYVSLFTVVYFAASALFRPRRRSYDLVGASLFIVFCYVVAMKVMDILF
jgi:hypothetical protein